MKIILEVLLASKVEIVRLLWEELLNDRIHIVMSFLVKAFITFMSLSECAINVALLFDYF